MLSIVIMGLYSPIEDFLYVYTPEIILNMLADEKPFHIVAAAAVTLTVVGFLNSAIFKLARAYFAKQKTSISLQANREIYEKAVHVDYKYIDDPKYYDNFAWAVEEYSTQLEKARSFLIDFAQCTLSIILLGKQYYYGEVYRDIYKFDHKTEEGLSRYNIYSCRYGSDEITPDGYQDIAL